MKKWIKSLITNYVMNSKSNSFNKRPFESAFEKPMVGFSTANDPLYDFLKRDIGDFYWHPLEIFSERYPDEKISPDRLSIISWVLPQTKQTKKDQQKASQYPVERWARAKLFGESFNNNLRNYVVKTLNDSGYPSLAPAILSNWERKISDKYGYASVWSERHTAYISGLGTFGLSDGLITQLGKAVRFGSVVSKIDIQPTKRSYDTHHDYCLFYVNGKCKKCVERCPANAISEEGHDKIACKKYIREVTAEYTKTNHGIRENSCGLCQVGVPCESKIPPAK